MHLSTVVYFYCNIILNDDYASLSQLELFSYLTPCRPAKQQHSTAVKSINMSTSDSPVRLVSSIGHGAIQDDNNESNNAIPSWAEFNALAQQTKAMQERIDTIEKQQQHQPAPLVDEGVGLLGSDEDNKSRRLSHLTESQVDAKYDEYELPESSYSLLMTEKVLSVPFFTGIFSAFLSMFALILALK